MSSRASRPPRPLGQLWRHVSRRSAGTPHRHPELEFNFVISGRARYELGGRSYDLVPNTLVWLFPGQTHVLLDRSPQLELVIGMFSPDLVRRYTTQPSNAVLRQSNPTEAYCRVLAETEAAGLRRLYSDTVWQNDDLDQVNAALGYALTCSWRVFRSAATQVPGVALHPAVERALRVLGEVRLEGRFDTIARRSGLSPSRLALLFREQVGVTPGEFRTRCCLSDVLDKLGRNRSSNLLETALEAGFSSYLQFYRAFRKQYGVSPRIYKKRLELQ